MSEQEPPPVDDAVTGLPWPTTWAGVYRLVMAFFVLYVLLLVLLRVSFA